MSKLFAKYNNKVGNQITMKNFDMLLMFMSLLFVSVMFYPNNALSESTTMVSAPNDLERHILILNNTKIHGLTSSGGCFEPSLLVINEGTKVMWINNDSRSHIISSGIRVETTDGTSTSFDGQFQSDHLATNETFSYIFTNSGVYDYNSWIYEECIGKIIVEPSNYYDIASPLKQLKAGVAVDDLQCKENLFLIQKYDDSPACVTFETKSKLIERGWAKPI